MKITYAGNSLHRAKSNLFSMISRRIVRDYYKDGLLQGWIITRMDYYKDGLLQGWIIASKDLYA